ncbi:unnamed protein product [Prorocentrum cordatum]|uniref:HMG box domain-containing protein n=1 Tax=Prorocentrum cordatum TaxID=2364126 RepID=A0ABN9YFB1_9DINO|nr:unnamed protein product [Polarella glacialis]
MAAELEEPKKPQTAYWIWLGENRDALTKEAGTMKGSVVAKLGGEKWKGLSATAKKPFEDRSAKLKADYDTAMEKFKASGGQVGKRRLEKKEAKDAKADKKAKKDRVLTRVSLAQGASSSRAVSAASASLGAPVGVGGAMPFGGCQRHHRRHF